MKYLVVLIVLAIAAGLVIAARNRKAATAWAAIVDDFALRVKARPTEAGIAWTQGLSQGTWSTGPQDPLWLSVEAGYAESEFLYPTGPDVYVPLKPSRALRVVKSPPSLPHRLVSSDASHVEHMLEYGLGRHLAAAPPVSIRLDPAGRLTAHPLPGREWSSKDLVGAAATLTAIAELLRGR